MAHSWHLKPLDNAILELVKSAPYGCYSAEIIEELRKDPKYQDVTIDDLRGRLIWLKSRQFLVNREDYDRKYRVWELGPNAYRGLQQTEG